MFEETAFTIKVSPIVSDDGPEETEDIEFTISSSNSTISCSFWDTPLHGLYKATERIKNAMIVLTAPKVPHNDYDYHELDEKE